MKPVTGHSEERLPTLRRAWGRVARAPNGRWAVELALFATAYVLLGRLGLSRGPVYGFASLFWAPAGLSLGVLLWRGLRLWPGVALGALITNLWSGAPMAAAMGIAAGNTL